MDFRHLFNQRNSHTPREYIHVTAFESPLASDSRRRENTFPAPGSHHDSEWSWHREADYEADQYILSPNEPYVNYQEFPSQFEGEDFDHIAPGPSSPSLNRESVPFPPFNIHTRNSTSPRDQHSFFPGSRSHFDPRRDHRHHPHHHHSFPTRQRESVSPQICEPTNTSHPAAYSVEEPSTPPPQNACHQNPHQQTNRRPHLFLNSSRPWHHRSPSQRTNRASLPPRTQRCEALPSSASSTAPSTPSQHHSSRASSPRANSPVQGFWHATHDYDPRDRNHRGTDIFDTDPHLCPHHRRHFSLHSTVPPRTRAYPHTHTHLQDPRDTATATVSQLAAQRRALRVQHRQLCALRVELERLGRRVEERERRRDGRREGSWGGQPE